MQKKILILHFLISLLLVAVLVAVFDYVVLQNLLQDEWGAAPYRITVPFPFAEKVFNKGRLPSNYLDLLGQPHRKYGSGFIFYEWDLCFGNRMIARLGDPSGDAFVVKIAPSEAGCGARWLIFPGIVLCLSGIETFLYWKVRGKKRTKETSA